MVVFKKDHDEIIKQAKLGGHSMDDALTRQPLAGKMDDVKSALHSEQDGRPSADGEGQGSINVAEPVDSDAEQGTNPADIGISIRKVKDDQGQLAEWVSFARNMASRYIKLQTDPEGSGEICAFLKNHSITGLQPGKHEYIHVLYDVSRAGEASARPHLRPPPLREEHLNRSIKGVLQAFSPTGELDGVPDGLAFFMLDRSPHNGSALSKAFSDAKGKVLKKVKSSFYVQTSEQSERLVKQRVKGIGTLSTVQGMTVFTNKTLDLLPKDHLHCNGSNCCDFLGPFERCKPGSLWQVRHKEKSSLYGKALIAVGGTVDGDAGPDEDPGPKAKDLVPFSWHGMPTEFYEELLHSFGGVGIIDLTATDPVVPLAALRVGKSYWGLCCTKEHQEALEKEITNQIFKAMQNPTDKLYEHSLRDALPESARMALEKDKDKKPRPKPKPKNEPNPKKDKDKDKDKDEDVMPSPALLEKLRSLDGQLAGNV